MAHPKLTGRVDRRVLLAAGAAAAMLGLPATATAGPLDGVSADALPIEDATDTDVIGTVGDTLDCLTTACGEEPAETASEAATSTTGDALSEVTSTPGGTSGAVSEVTDLLPEEVRAATDPVTGVVDDVVRSVPGVVADPVGSVEQTPDVVDNVIRSVGSPVPGVDVPTPSPPEDVGTAGSPAGVRSGPVQGPRASTRPPFAPRPTSVTTTPPSRPSPSFYAPPVITAPFTGDLPRIAEDLLARSPVSSGIEAIRDAAAAPVSGPDAPSWLLATAGGLLLLVGSGHVIHARNRHRYVASVAR